MKHDAAALIRETEARAREEADKHARNIVGIAIQRFAADHTAETTVSVVHLPSDDMKGRIIGREGRNIRALEQLTGVDLIIDDTPEAVILSSFDPVRREIAASPSRRSSPTAASIPARIEEVFNKADDARRPADRTRQASRPSFDTRRPRAAPRDLRTLGRLKYRTSYGQNVLKHSLEVALPRRRHGRELGVDVQLAQRAGLLHDIGKAIDHEMEGTHAVIGADLARRLGESEAVVHGIAAHHGDVEPPTLEAVLVQAADAISAARPGARRETLETYIKRLEKLEGSPDSPRASRSRSRCRPAARSASWSSPRKISDGRGQAHRTRTSRSRSRTRSSTPARSR